MARNICRLCFEEKTSSISIFTSEGFLLGVASAIRMHFLDEVTEDDVLPKFVCTECWNKLQDFNKFYNAVDEAKNIYLNRTAKEEVPESNGINVDADECDDDIASVKSEPLDFDAEVWKEQSPQEVSLSTQKSFYEYEYENGKEYYYISEEVTDDRKIQNSIIKENEMSTTRVVVLPKVITDTPATINGTPQISKRMSMTCERCDLPIKTLSELIKHYQDEHKEERIQMKCCETKLKINELLDHMKYHENPDQYRCDRCQKYFTLAKHLSSHKTECGTRSTGSQFPLAELHDHMKYHVSPMTYRCNQCSKNFISTKDLNTHMKCHSPLQLVEPLKLSEIHTSKKKTKIFQCLQCAKHFFGANVLKEHMSNVHNYSQYQCQVCGNDFKTGPRLKEHMVKHTGEYLYKCNYCPKLFKFKSGICRHFKTFHPVEYIADRATHTRTKYGVMNSKPAMPRQFGGDSRSYNQNVEKSSLNRLQ